MKPVAKSDIMTLLEAFKSDVLRATGKEAIVGLPEDPLRGAEGDVFRYYGEDWADDKAIERLAFLIMGEHLRMRFGHEVMASSDMKDIVIIAPKTQTRYDMDQVRKKSLVIQERENEEEPSFQWGMEEIYDEACREAILS